MTEQLPVLPFHGAELRAVKDGDTIWVALKPICEHLGVDTKTQLDKLRQDEDFQLRAYPLTSTDGKSYSRGLGGIPATLVVGGIAQPPAGRGALAKAVSLAS